MYFLICVIFVVISAILFEIYYNKPHKDAAKKLPGPATLPFVGNAHLLKGDGAVLYNLLKEFSAFFGPILRVLIGSNLFVVMNTAEYFEPVMNNSVLIGKSDEYKNFYPWLGTGLLTSGGSKWRKRRKMLTPAFHFKILENFTPVFDRNSDVLIKKLSAYENHDSVDVFPLITLCALDVISESAMGVSVNAQEFETSEYVRAVKAICQILIMRMKSILLRFEFFFKLSMESRIHDNAIKTLHSYTIGMIQEKRQLLQDNKTDHNNDDTGIKNKMAFLDLLLRTTIDGEKLNDESVREEVDTFLFEGHDTTTSGISFALYSIANNEDVQNKLYEEQKEIFGDDMKRASTYSDLQNMKYMDMAIKEALRLYPSVPMIARKAEVDTQIREFLLPAGTTLLLNVMTLHRDPDVYPEPDKFIPERFTAEECAKRNPYAYVAFSAGPRNCIGQKFAMLEMKSIVSKVLRNFKLLPVDVPLKLAADIILVSYNGVHIKIVKR